MATVPTKAGYYWLKRPGALAAFAKIVTIEVSHDNGRRELFVRGLGKGGDLAYHLGSYFADCEFIGPLENPFEEQK